jgi:4-alpha-glucanotransferase
MIAYKLILMKTALHFQIQYQTKSGQQLAILLKQKSKEKAIETSMLMDTRDGINWFFETQISDNQAVEYKYFVKSYDVELTEFGQMRSVFVAKKQTSITIKDYWRPLEDVSNAYFSAAFKDVIFKRNAQTEVSKSKSNSVTLRLNAALIESHQSFCVMGSCKAMGFWSQPILMSDVNFPVWEAGFELLDNEHHFEYKYAIFNHDTNDIEHWEFGQNRIFNVDKELNFAHNLVQTDEAFRYPFERWKGAGVAIPVFSIRSQNGLGIGEFCDLHLMVDWAKKTGLKMLQILPVNDTIATKTWLDSYPYGAISVFALHPLYVNIQNIGKLKDKAAQQRLDEGLIHLNQSETVDFEAVMKLKFELFEILYQENKASFFKKSEFKSFMECNESWLKPYAAFCYLRDKNETVIFTNWKKHNEYSDEVIDKICDPKFKDFDKVALYYFIQFHANKQLLAATNYARSRGVILKGDLPIGIYRYSCDAWVAPHLYNMDGQAGAPPDDYAVDGQNWGFPTYNWTEMAKDNFAWWRQRMTALSVYFDALRIDHILGFFRIWQIPTNQVQGTLGLFNPRLPYSIQDLHASGLVGALARFTKPYIYHRVVTDQFGADADFVFEHFLNHLEAESFELKPFVDNQQKIKSLFETAEYNDKKHLEKPLMNLVTEVLLLEEDTENGKGYNPRITLFTTRSYKELSWHNQQTISKLYDDYYFKRHDSYWRDQALWKLPALINATNMFICGEDLGMIPKSVPGVMSAMNVAALEIQRMPKGATEFGDTSAYPYFTVCSPSCHDMSTIRGWWETDAQLSQRFYNSNLRWYGPAPKECSPLIVEAIVDQHLKSPSMWAVFPLQDLVGIDADLRRKDAAAEQINQPSNPQHYWRFRFHLTMEELLETNDFNEKIAWMVDRVGR